MLRSLFITIAVTVGCNSMLIAEEIKDYAFEWFYKAKGDAIITIVKTGDITYAVLHPYGHKKLLSTKGDSPYDIHLKDIPSLQEAMRVSMEARNKWPNSTESSKLERIKTDTHVIVVGKAQYAFNRQQQIGEKKVRIPFNGVTVSYDAMEFFAKELPGLPAAIKLVDEKIGAAVK